MFKGQGIGDVTISAGEGLTATTTAEGVYVLNNVTAGSYTIQVGKTVQCITHSMQRVRNKGKKRNKWKWGREKKG